MRLTLKSVQRDISYNDTSISRRTLELRGLCNAREYNAIRLMIHNLNSEYYESLRSHKLKKFSSLLARKHPDVHNNSHTNSASKKIVVTIPDDIALSEDERAVLSKGLSFVPCRDRPDDFDVRRDFEAFARRLRLKAHFESDDDRSSQDEPAVHTNEDTSNSQTDTSILSDISPPIAFDKLQPRRSTWTPPEGQFHSLDLFITKCRHDINTVINQTASNPLPSSNLSESEKSAIQSLRNNTDYVIKPADKGGAVVVWKRDLYIAEGLRQLSDTAFYEEIDVDPTDEHQHTIVDTVNTFIRDGKLPPDAEELIQSNPRCPVFYMLPKIHKEGNPGRPIVSTVNCPTEIISEYLDSIFAPMVEKLQTYVKDSSEMLRILESVTLPDDGPKFLFTMDVRSLYTIIPRADGLSAVRSFLEQNPSHNRPDNDTILRLTDLVLSLSAFNFNSKYYKQKKGVAMGTKMGPSYACLFMGYLETSVLSTCGEFKPLLLKRYIDDYFGVATCGEEEVHNLIEKFNTFHPAVKMTHEVSDRCVSFLDIDVTITSTGLATSVHYKPTDSHAYLNYRSSHPPSCKRSIPYSQLTRIRRLCSEDGDFRERVEEMTEFFRHRGYPDNILDTAKNRIMDQPRTATLQQAERDTVSRVPFVLTYHPANHQIVKVIRDNFSLLQDDHDTKRIFTEPPFISYRKDRSLRQMLVHSKLPTTREQDSTTINIGTSPCRRPRCKTCKVLSSSPRINGPRSSWEVKGSFTCTTTDCIYAIRCKLCDELYVGETKRRLADRVAEHLRSITLDSTGLPVATHFNSANHSIAHFEVRVLLAGFRSSEARKEQEERLIHRLGCLHPNGMNVSFRSFTVN